MLLTSRDIDRAISRLDICSDCFWGDSGKLPTIKEMNDVANKCVSSLFSCQKPFKKSYLFLDASKSDKFEDFIYKTTTHEAWLKNNYRYPTLSNDLINRINEGVIAEWKSHFYKKGSVHLFSFIQAFKTVDYHRLNDESILDRCLQFKKLQYFREKALRKWWPQIQRTSLDQVLPLHNIFGGFGDC